MRFILVTFIVALALMAAAASQPTGQKHGIAIPIAKRSSLVNDAKSVNIEALKANVESTKAKILRGFKNFQKNTGTTHPADLQGNQRRATGADALTDNKNVMWYGPISVGTPAKTFTVDFDTGSSDLFLPGPQCRSSNCQRHTIYDPSASSTSADLGKTFELKYGDGSSVSGEQYTDTVTVAGLTATNQTLGVASEYSSSFAVDQYPADGLMGMGFQSISIYGASPVFQSLMSQGKTDAPVFSFKLADSGSELLLGGANSDLYTGEFTYTPVKKKGYWEVNLGSIEGNGRTILSNIDCIIDTGSTAIMGDPSSVKELYQKLGGTDASSTVGEGYYSFPCNSFPSVNFTFGGTSFPISAETLNLGPVSPGSSDCASGIISQNIGISFWIVGDVFLRNVYTTFDVGKARVGFAQLA